MIPGTGSRISWSAPIYIFSADFADILPPDEDPMPFDGNPHPLPGHLQFNNHNWVMPEFPEIGWDELPPPMKENAPNDQEIPHDDLNIQEEIVEENQVNQMWLLNCRCLGSGWGLSSKGIGSSSGGSISAKSAEKI